MTCSLSSETGPSPLFGFQENLFAFGEGTLSWEQVQTALEESHAKLLDTLEQACHRPWGGLVEERLNRALDLLETFPAEVPEPGWIREFCRQLRRLGGQLEPAFREFTERQAAEDEKQQLLELLNFEISDSELEAGHFGEVADWLGDVFEEEQPAEEAVLVMTSLHQRFRRELGNYQSTYICPSEWTVRVALSDELLLQGYSLWLEGLELATQACNQRNEEVALESLELLRAGNRNFIQVEHLAISPAGAGAVVLSNQEGVSRNGRC